jgi:heterotetrameric sarcosine oxidase delta subunit
MRIRCPFCGERDSGEYTYLGANVRRSGASADDEQSRLFEAVYLRENPAGRHQELWYHAFGCRSWLVVTRDTSTHEILAVDLAKETVSS